MKSRRPIVALVEWHWGGHHPTYFAHFVLALEELGCSVIAICFQPSQAKNDVEALRKLKGTDVSKNADSVFLQLPPQRRSYLPLPRLRQIHRAISRFTNAQRLINDSVRRNGVGANLVFYACIYDWDFWDIRFALPFLLLPWSGLYLHARSLRMSRSNVPLLNRPADPTRIFVGRNLNSVGVLDEGVAQQLENLINKPVVVFPDLTDERLPETAADSELASNLRSFADGRRIVGLFGFLHYTKGLTTFAKMIRSRRWDGICFAVAGEINWSDFSAEDRREIESALEDKANVWRCVGRIPDGPVFNGLVRTCDIVFAAYLNFPHSSNILTKAALLRKPVIVSDGYLMAERARRFRLGEIIPEGDVGAAAAAIRRLSAADSLSEPPDWDGYLKKHSFDALKVAFAELLDCIDERPKASGKLS